MKLRSILAALLPASITFSASFAQSPAGGRHSIAHIGFVYPLSTNGLDAPKTTNSFSLHALAGVGYAENGFALSGITTIVKTDASGMQLAGISNHTGGGMSGVQIGGIINTVAGDADGFMLAGIANTSANASGMQLAGIVNVARDVDGIQIAGLINKARVVRGVQIAGLINIADSCDAPIGLINIIRNGELGAGASLDESGNAMLSFRSGGKLLYGILGAGRNLSHRGDGLWALEAGLGMHVTLSRHFRINLEGSVLSLGERRMNDAYLRSGLRLLPAVTIGRRLEVFAGPSFNQVYYTHSIGHGLQHDAAYFWQHQGRGWFSGLYFGALAGVQVRI